MASNPFPVVVHPFPSQLPFSCAYERGDGQCRNALVFIGGLTSGPHTTQLDSLVKTLQASPDLSYSCWEFRMRSSYTGFGYSSLANDAEDLSSLVNYLKDLGKEKIVLLGSSTGCQDIMEYTNSKYNADKVDAYILQAPTSDRETASLLMPPDYFQTTLTHAQDMITRGEQNTIVPQALILPIFTSPLTAYRWHSLISKGGDDDYFSSDLDDETLARTFGRLTKPTLILPSENDEMVPPTVDKGGLLQRWIRAAPEGVVCGLSGVNPGADHGLSGEGARAWFGERVLGFLAVVGGG
ncbi:hypothetical protein GQ44DRAFT_628263 [Phaeosphaeriaceae sp. PMI808]|nr:hypothetical protein GQ44DRAFT_628263 [Phaeosphaeriaceae sp. PMI808]